MTGLWMQAVFLLGPTAVLMEMLGCWNGGCSLKAVIVGICSLTACAAGGKRWGQKAQPALPGPAARLLQILLGPPGGGVPFEDGRGRKGSPCREGGIGLSPHPGLQLGRLTSPPAWLWHSWRGFGGGPPPYLFRFRRVSFQWVVPKQVGLPQGLLLPEAEKRHLRLGAKAAEATSLSGPALLTWVLSPLGPCPAWLVRRALS